MTLPRLAMVSTGIRRDLIEPLKHFTRFEMAHLYRYAEYGDLTPGDLDEMLRPYRSPYDLYRQLVRMRPQVIQGVEPFSAALQPYLWACFAAAATSRARILSVAFENRPVEAKFGRPIALLLCQVLNVYFRRACLVLVLNEGARRNVARCGIAGLKVQKLMWGAWGVDLDEFSPSQEMDRHPPSILFAGRLVTEKGIFPLLDAFARVQRVLPEAGLTIVGDGPERSSVEDRVKTWSGVRLAGVVKNRLMPDMLRAADVVAMPSLTTRKWEEQVGMVAIQAMACGVPVVATSSGAIPEYVPDGMAGLLVPENDPEALARALIRILQDRHLHDQMARGAREYACEHYDAAKNIDNAERALLGFCS